MSESLQRHRSTRRLAAIAFLDVVDYSRLMGLSEESTLHAWTILRTEVIEPRIREWRGRVANRAGDGIFAEFGSALDALQWAIDVQRVVEHQASIAEPMRLRIALHLADVIDDHDGGVMGNGVNIAARLQGHAVPGGIVVSQALIDAVAGKTETSFIDLGWLRLKNIARPIHAFRLRLELEPAQVRSIWKLPTRTHLALAGIACMLIALAAPILTWRTSPREQAEHLLQQGLAVACQAYPCPQAWLASRAFFEQAIAVDPTFARPYAEAAFTYTNFVSSDLSTDRNEDLRAAAQLATRAVALAPDQAFSHEARGAVFRQDPNTLESALSAYLRAVAIDPKRVASRANAGWILVLLGRTTEGETYLLAALAMAPNFLYAPAWLTNLGLAELFLDREGHGIEYFRRAIAQQSKSAADADIGIGRALDLAAALALNGDLEDAKKEVDEIRLQHPAISTHNLLWNCECSHNPVFRAGLDKLRRGVVLAGVLDAG